MVTRNPWSRQSLEARGYQYDRRENGFVKHQSDGGTSYVSTQRAGQMAAVWSDGYEAALTAQQDLITQELFRVTGRLSQVRRDYEER